MKRNKYKIPIWKYNYKSDTPTSNPKFIQLYHSQITHKNFLNLSNSAKVVYMYMIDYSNGKMETTFPNKIYSIITSKPTFFKSIKELSKKGFLEVIESGRFNHKENKYKFLCDWYK